MCHICPSGGTTGRRAEPVPLWQPAFPSAELVQHAADLIPHITAGAVGRDCGIVSCSIECR